MKNFESIVNTLKDPNNKHIYQFNVDERYPKELFDDYFKALKGRKYKKNKNKLTLLNLIKRLCIEIRKMVLI